MAVRIQMTVGNDPEEIRAAALGLAAISLVQMRKSHFPRLYESGIRYEKEQGSQVFQTAAETLARMRGDCEDLCAYRVAELQRSGEKATIVVKRMSPAMLHVLVRRANGKVEDPSRILGM